MTVRPVHSACDHSYDPRVNKKIAAVALVLSLLAVGCGGDDSESVTDTTSAGQEVESFSVGFSTGSGRTTFLRAIDDALRAYVEQAGGTYETIDAALDVNKQVADIDQLVATGVDAIVVVAIDARAVDAALSRARDAGIKVFAFFHQLNYDGAPPSAPIDGQVLDGRPQMAVEQAAYLADRLDGGAEVVYVDFGIPVPAIGFLRDAFADELSSQGLTLVETVATPTDDTDGALPLVDAMLTAHRDLGAVVAFSDPTAVGAARAVQSAGRGDDVTVLGTQLLTEGVEAIRAGDVAASWDSQPIELARALSELIIAAMRGEPESEWQRTVIVEPRRYDSTNIDDWVPWEDQIDAIGG